MTKTASAICHLVVKKTFMFPLPVVVVASGDDWKAVVAVVKAVGAALPEAATVAAPAAAAAAERLAEVLAAAAAQVEVACVEVGEE